jgi:hypothetical protein
MMMQENNRSLNYTKIDRCQDKNSIDNDEYYRQILHLNEHFYNCEQDIKIIFNNRLRTILFVFFILISQSNALPLYPSYIQSPPSSLPVAMVQLTEQSVYPQQTYKIYRRFPNQIEQPMQPIPSYSNGAVVQIYDQTNSHNQQQFRRERQRRAMIDKIVTIFDEDGSSSFYFRMKILFCYSCRKWTINKR